MIHTNRERILASILRYNCYGESSYLEYGDSVLQTGCM